MCVHVCVRGLSRERWCASTGRLQLNATLGYPDFEPATSDAEEDKLTDERLKSGWTGRGLGGKDGSLDEYGSMEDSFHAQWQQIQQMRAKLGIPEPTLSTNRAKKLRAKCDLFPEPGGGNVDGGLHAWLARLADPQVHTPPPCLACLYHMLPLPRPSSLSNTC